MSRANPTFDDVKGSAESIKRKRGFFTQATELRSQYFHEKFSQIPEDLQELFIKTREDYHKLIESDIETDPSLIRYYRRAAR